MNYQGRNIFKGINFQTLAAFSLYLQYLNDKEFSYIQLEAPDLSDFYLVFNDNHKIICESKNYSTNLTDYHVKKILKKIIASKSINDNDEILIICKKSNTDIFKKVKDLKFYKNILEDFLKKRGFGEEFFNVVTKINLWEIEDNLIEDIIFSLFYELIGFWLPDKQIKRIVDNILIEKFYKGSAEGAIFTREDIFKEIEHLSKEIKSSTTIFNEEINTLEEQINHIIKAVEKDSVTFGPFEIESLTQDRRLMYFLLDKLKDIKGVKLLNWDTVLRASNIPVYIHSLFQLFKNNIDTSKNREYVLNYINDELDRLNTYYRENFLENNLADVFKEIVNNDNGLNNFIFEIIKKQFKKYGSSFFYVKSKSNLFYMKEDLCNVLKTLYDSSNSKIKSDIYNFIIDTFNLVADDDDEHNHYTPVSIFSLLKEYLTFNNNKFLKKRFNILKNELVKQHEKYEIFSKEIKYDGWDHIGSVGAFWGNNYRVFDKYFIKYLLIPAINNIPEDNRWNFVKDNCIFSEKEVAKDNPDFLNRASIPILIEEYKKNNKEAFSYLKNFIFSRKGIPSKIDLLLQYLFDDKNITNKQKWSVVKIIINKCKMPISPFIELIVADLVSEGHKEAIEYLKNLMTDKDYFVKDTTIDRMHIIMNLDKLLNIDIELAAEIFKNMLFKFNYFDKISNFDLYDYSRFISKLIVKNINIGLDILKEIYKSKKLTTNQQILICSGIENVSEAKEIPTDKASIIIRVYNNFLKPILVELDSIRSIEEIFTCREARESIIKFAEKLAIIRKFDESLFIVNKFLNDVDPPKDGSNYSDDPDGTFNYHQKIIEGEDKLGITTVRGRIPWVLQKFTSFYGREYISRIVPIVENLLNDDNYYVRVQACVPLIELVKSRHNVIPGNKNERFLDIKIAKEIERIAFASLDDKKNQRLRIFMEYLALVFIYMISLDEKQAMHMFKVFIDLKDALHFKEGIEEKTKVSAYEDIIDKITSTLVFYAEFRKNAFISEKYKYIYLDNWDNLKKFDNEPFKQLLLDLLKNSSAGIRSGFAWWFYITVKKSKINFDIAFKYIKILVENYDHDIFRNIYMFIESNIKNKFEECYYLWTNCLISERGYIESNIKNIDKADVYWWPYFYNGKILNIALDKKGPDEFLKWLEFLLGYPKGVLVANDLDIAVEKIIDFPKDNTRVEIIFNKLIERNPRYFDFKSKWQNIMD